MDRSYASGAAGSAPLAPSNPSIGYPTAGNPGTGTPATKPGEYWFYMITEEIRKVISDAGLTPSRASVNQLSTAIQQMISNVALPAGSIVKFAKNTPPSGYLKANGAAVSRTTYAALFAVIGTAFGSGDGVSTFNLPDLRGQFIRGWDDGRGVDSGRVFGSAQADSFKSHAHDLLNIGAGSGGSLTSWVFTTTGNVYSVANTPSSLSGGAETCPRNIALLACIKF